MGTVMIWNASAKMAAGGEEDKVIINRATAAINFIIKVVVIVDVATEREM